MKRIMKFSVNGLTQTTPRPSLPRPMSLTCNVSGRDRPDKFHYAGPGIVTSTIDHVRQQPASQPAQKRGISTMGNRIVPRKQSSFFAFASESTILLDISLGSMVLVDFLDHTNDDNI